MSKPVFEDLFTFSGRRNRKSYFLYSLAIWAVSALIQMLAFTLDFELVFVVLIIIALPFLIIGVAVTAQRFRDFGWTGWSILWLIVPLANIVFLFMLFFKPGNVGKNRYGQDPLAKS